MKKLGLIGGTSWHVSYLNLENGRLKITYFSAGFNYYFKPTNSGFYSNIAYARSKYTINISKLDDSFWSSFFSFDNVHTEQRLNLKLGYRTASRVFFRGELGYGILLHQTAMTTSPTATVESSETLGAGLLLNLGLGIAFL